MLTDPFDHVFQRKWTGSLVLFAPLDAVIVFLQLFERRRRYHRLPAGHCAIFSPRIFNLVVMKAHRNIIRGKPQIDHHDPITLLIGFLKSRNTLFRGRPAVVYIITEPV